MDNALNVTSTTNDAIGFFEAIAIQGLEGEDMRIPAATQRHFFGNVPFGKKKISVDNRGRVELRWKVAFGQDFDSLTVYWDSFLEVWREVGSDEKLKAPLHA